MAFDKIYTGKDMRPLTSREIKAYVMKQRGISSEEYNKLYDRTRNKVRNYERYTGEKIGNVANYLYKLELDKATGRSEYQSRQKKLIEHAPTISTGAPIEKVEKAYDPYIDEQVRKDFAALIEADPKSKKLAETLYGLELKNALSARGKAIADYKKSHGGGGGGGGGGNVSGDDDIFDDTDYAFSYSEV